MVPSLACASDNGAEAALTASLSGIQVFPLPGRVRVDCGTEKVAIAEYRVSQKKTLHVFKILFFDIM